MSQSAVLREAAATDIDARLAAVDWDRIGADLDRRGHALIPGLLMPDECAALIAGYADDARFRSTIDMARYGFGRGQYRYFAYPLPERIATLRSALYPRLVGTANRWAERLGSDGRYPATLDGFLRRCHAAGQRRPTPLLLKYEPGDYNCLHQDLYGELRFPLQVTALLSQVGRDFEGGEFVLTEQRPRRQSRAQVVSLRQGDAVAFAVNERPVQGTRGDYRVRTRHGVSEVTAGRRFAAGIIFHDAE